MKVQKIANVIVAYGYYQREIKKMDKKLTFFILFSNHQIANRKYKKRRKMLNTIFFTLIQQQEILGNTLLWGLVPRARRFWMIDYGQNWFERPGLIILINIFVKSGDENFGLVLKHLILLKT